MRSARILCLALCLLPGLAACGVDGAPKPPAKTGVTVEGEVTLGVRTGG